MAGKTKDYKALYEEAKQNLKDEAAWAVNLYEEVEQLKKEAKDFHATIELRERIARDVMGKLGYADGKTCEDMLAWILGTSRVPQKPKKRGRKAKPKVLKMEVAAKPKKGKRKYTKRSKFWAKKK